MSSFTCAPDCAIRLKDYAWDFNLILHSLFYSCNLNSLALQISILLIHYNRNLFYQIYLLDPTIFWVLASKVRRPQTGSVLNKQSHSLGLKYLCWHGNHLRDFSGLTFSKAHFYLCMTDRRIYCTSINQRSPVFRCNVHFCVFACMFLATCFCLIKRITI